MKSDELLKRIVKARVEELLHASSQPSIHEHMRPGAGSSLSGTTTSARGSCSWRMEIRSETVTFRTSCKPKPAA